MEGPQWIGAREQREMESDEQGKVTAGLIYLLFGYELGGRNLWLMVPVALLVRWAFRFGVQVPVMELCFLYQRLRWGRGPGLDEEYAAWKRERWRL